MAILLQTSFGAIVADVREAIRAGNLADAERLVREHRERNGDTPEALEALSWVARGALASKQWNRAEEAASETRRLVLERLKTQGLAGNRSLEIALGASIEVQAQTMAARGSRSEAVAFLNRELTRWRDTPLRTRIQKNVNLLSLTGRPAPALEAAPPDALKGRPVLLFFWAHWCGDCKAQAKALARVQEEFGPRGLAIVAPTRLYGYAARGEDAEPEQEIKYIESVRERFYGEIDMPAPISEENFHRYGASTTPTLVLIDRQGIVRLYHPGELTYGELSAAISELLPPKAS